ncbi:MAG TPA: molecular chaperone DnaJ [Gammaproteobacteria bacterium]|nr:molecular chaperone DnaJ [Gammaproteobacteria bacterium]
MRHNPLTAAILTLLQDAPEGLSEFDIISGLKSQGLYIDDLDDPAMTLFTGHFLVMNALYSLQRDLLSEQLFLSISALENRLYPVCGQLQGSGQLQVDTADAALSDYYLDWSNLDTMSAAGVDKLLNSFWERFVAEDQEGEALQTLGLEAGADWANIRRSYRRLAAVHHPDKGGDAQAFVRIREAYETLKVIRR